MAWGYMFKRSVLGDMRFTPGIYHEDEEFTPQLLLRCARVFDTNAQAYFYRQRTGSITHNFDKAFIGKRLEDILYIIDHLQCIARQSSIQNKVALERRVAQLTMDYIYNTILLTRSEERLNETLEDLRKDNLFPLPNHPYSTKYTWFRRLSNNALGRKILLTTLPLMKKER